MTSFQSITLRKKYPYLEFSGPYTPAFGLNAEIYRVNIRIQSECGKVQTGKTPNFDTFYTVSPLENANFAS